MALRGVDRGAVIGTVYLDGGSTNQNENFTFLEAQAMGYHLLELVLQKMQRIS